MRLGVSPLLAKWVREPQFSAGFRNRSVHAVFA